MNPYDVIVVGAGIIGLSSGYYLSRAGKRVLVLDAGEFGGGASGSCDDVIVLQSKRPGITLELALQSMELYEGLSAELGVELEFEHYPFMILIESPDSLPVMQEFVAQQRSAGVPVQIVDQKELRRRQPHINPGFHAATYCPRDARVNPFRVMLGFQGAGKALGMSVKRNMEVTGIAPRAAGGFRVQVRGGEAFESEVLLNCAGAWAPRIGGLLGLSIPIEPKRGQLIVTESVPPVGETNALNAEYLIVKLRPELAPKRSAELEKMGLSFSFSRTHDGNYLIGSSREKVGYDKGTTMEALQAIASQAVRIFPVLRDVHIIRFMGGLRPASTDGLPIIGEHPQVPGFFTAAGHEGDGIALAPVTGLLVSQLITGSRPLLEPGALSPGRFTRKEEAACVKAKTS